MPTLSEVAQRFKMRWDIDAAHGGFLAIRRHGVSEKALKRGLVNILAADSVEKLHTQLVEQDRLEHKTLTGMA